jgi:phospholipase C
VYHDDLFPQVLAIQHMIDPFRLNTPQFSSIRRGGEEFFVNDLANGYDVDYTFIEPDYGLASVDFESGNCQHPVGSMAAGDAFIQYVYESIRNSPVWPDSLLIITYDEHGGFFDRQEPPRATPPGDDDRNRGRAKNPQNFSFNQLGVRVPAVAVSPWIAPGVGSQRFPGQAFDHTSIIATVLGLFAEGATITARDAAAPSFASIASLPQIRTDQPEMPAAAFVPAAQTAAQSAAPSATQTATQAVSPSEGMINGFSRIAMSLDLSVAGAHQTPYVALAHPSFSLPSTATASGPQAVPGAPPPPVIAPARSTQETLRYIQAVADRVGKAQASDP